MADMWLLDEIFPGSAAPFVKDLRRLKGKEVDLFINSPGGDWADGQAMGAAVSAHGNVTSHVIGIAGSSATIPALSARKVLMAKGSMLFVHDPSVVTSGRAEDMERAANDLRSVAEQIAVVYRRSGKDDATIRRWMAEQTLFSAEEAVGLGLADSIEEAPRIAAKIDPSRLPAGIRAKLENAMSNQDNAPQVNEIRAAYRAASRLRIEASVVDQLIDDGTDVSTLSDKLIEIKAQREAAQNPPGSMIPSGISFARSNTVDVGQLQEAVVAQMTGKPVAGNPWVGRRPADIARQLHQSYGRNVTTETDESVIEYKDTAPRFRAEGLHVTTDFPSLLAAGAEKTFLGARELAQSPLLSIGARRDVPNFLTQKVISISAFPSLQKVLESGEITRGTIADTAESVTAFSYGRIFSVSRQALVNDPFGALASQELFTQQGMMFKVTHDFYAGAVEAKAIFRNAGA